MDVNEYRRRNPRCRTCQHARVVKGSLSYYDGWTCDVKNTFHHGRLEETKWDGILCGMYLPKEERNEN